MAKLDIIKLPDPILRVVSKPIAQVNAAVRRLADDMLETMYKAPGIGLAAIQVAEPVRLIVIDTADEDEGEEPEPLVLINPEIVKLSSAMRVHDEGCLSIPDVRVEIERPSALTLTYLDRDGKKQQLDAEGILATAIQHELDHLNGRMIIDYMSRLKRDMVIRRFKKMAR